MDDGPIPKTTGSCAGRNGPAPGLQGCRPVDIYSKLNRIGEGTFGIVYRAQEKSTHEIVALKRLKIEDERSGFPITSLRELEALLYIKHPNILSAKEVVTSPEGNIFIVMEFVEHDLRTLMENISEPFLQSEVKTVLIQVLSAVKVLHEHYIIHRDLKTSNLLLNNGGNIKVADFGSARKFGSPLGDMTPVVVTLWYRAPEILLGERKYTSAVDIWSIGCIFGELIDKEPLFAGRSEVDQLNKIFTVLGSPNHKTWPGFDKLPNSNMINFGVNHRNHLRERFPYLTESGLDLLKRMLSYDPSRRITADEALEHPYFKEPPMPKDPSLFPTFPSQAEEGQFRTKLTPSAPMVVHGLGEEERSILGTLGFEDGKDRKGFKLRLR